MAACDGDWEISAARCRANFGQLGLQAFRVDGQRFEHLAQRSAPSPIAKAFFSQDSQKTVRVDGSMTRTLVSDPQPIGHHSDIDVHCRRLRFGLRS
jgi:hypothetical protein